MPLEPPLMRGMIKRYHFVLFCIEQHLTLMEFVEELQIPNDHRADDAFLGGVRVR